MNFKEYIIHDDFQFGKSKTSIYVNDIKFIDELNYK